MNKITVSPSSGLPPEQLDLVPAPALLPWEDRSQFEALRAAILADLKPTSIHQLALAARIVACHWEQFRGQKLTVDVMVSGYRKAALHHLQNPPNAGVFDMSLVPDRTMLDLADALTGTDRNKRQEALDELDARGIHEPDIHARAYLQDFAALEALDRRPAKQDARLRSLMQDYRALQELDRFDGVPDATMVADDDD
jgi:hypothetical protein